MTGGEGFLGGAPERRASVGRLVEPRDEIEMHMGTSLLFTMIAFGKVRGRVLACYRLGLEPGWRQGRGEESRCRPYREHYRETQLLNVNFEAWVWGYIICPASYNMLILTRLPSPCAELLAHYYLYPHYQLGKMRKRQSTQNLNSHPS